MKSINTFLKVAIASAAVLAANPAHAATVVIADTTGRANTTSSLLKDNPIQEDAKNYYGVALFGSDSSIFVQSISYDLSEYRHKGKYRGYFDFNGASGKNFNNAFGPVIDSESLVGLEQSDITFTTDMFAFNSIYKPQFLTFNFAPNSFGTGDSFRFGADTDNIVRDPITPGNAFGEAGVKFTVRLENGDTFSAPFITLSPTSSEVMITIPDSPSVPEPMTIFGSVTAIGFGMLFRKIKRKQ